MAGNIEITSRIMKRIPLERLMDLKVDYAFKQLFGNERNREITIVFLNAVLKRTGTDRITGMKELEEIAMKDESLHQAFESWESLSRSPEEIYAYESRLKRILDEEALVREAELRGEERAEKRAEKKGEERALRKMARYMLSNGIEVGKVAEETGLKLQEVLEIQAAMRS